MSRVLVLDASRKPIEICGLRRAISLLFRGKARVVEHNGKMIAKNFPLPLVIRLRRYVDLTRERTLAPNRRNILKRDRYTCQYCGRRYCKLTLDHVLPRSRGGGSTWENLVAACSDCNCDKGDRTPAEAGMELLSTPLRPADWLSFELSTASSTDGMYECWSQYL
jgi:5-methylcytosine-specific restriction endonuclease McrA